MPRENRDKIARIRNVKLKKQVAYLTDSTVGSLAQDITVLANTINTQNQTITTLQNTVTTLTNRISALENA